MRKKHTISDNLYFSGVGIHSGEVVDCTLKPSDAGCVIFHRNDLNHREFRLDPGRVETRNSTTLLVGRHRIQTVEHLLAALSAMEIDSVVVELSGGEVPVMDGSALPFIEALRNAGLTSLEQARPHLRIREAFTLHEDEASIRMMPASRLEIFYRIQFDHPLIGIQEKELFMDKETFMREVAPARTFGFVRELKALHERNLARGAGLQNVIGLDDEGVVNGSLRFPDEFVRHKILDLIGDLSLLGYPLVGRVEADKAGHALHHKAVLHLAAHPDIFELTMDESPQLQ